jgi:hypothetical protein
MHSLVRRVSISKADQQFSFVLQHTSCAVWPGLAK